MKKQNPYKKNEDFEDFIDELFASEANNEIVEDLSLK